MRDELSVYKCATNLTTPQTPVYVVTQRVACIPREVIDVELGSCSRLYPRFPLIRRSYGRRRFKGPTLLNLCGGDVSTSGDTAHDPSASRVTRKNNSAEGGLIRAYPRGK